MNDPQPYDESIRDFYTGKSLSPEAMSSLKAAISTASAEPVVDEALNRPQTAPSGTRHVLLLAAAIAVLVGLSAVVVLTPGFDTTDAIVTEIAKNHRKNLQPEVTSADPADWQTTLDKLEFAVVLPPDLLADGYTPTGARYCSVQSELAIQMSLRDPSGRRVTLYQTSQHPTNAAATDGDFTYAETTVRIWRIGDRFYALASD